MTDPAMTITFSLDYQAPADAWGTYESIKTVETGDSIRNLALEIVHEALNAGINMWTPELSDSTSIQIYVASDNITNTKTGYDESGFGIKYALDDQGGLLVLSGYDPLGHDWKISEIQELVNEGYIKGDPTHIIIGLPEGLGGGGEVLFDMVGFLSASLQLLDYGYKGIRHFKNSPANKDARLIASQWATNGIRYPNQLREFIDTKGEWTTAEISRRLKLNEEQANKLLTSLGLELKGSSWRLTHSKQSLENRKRWMRNEKRYHTKSNLA